MGVFLLVLVVAVVGAYVWHRRTGALDDVLQQGRELRSKVFPSRPMSRRVLPRQLLRAAAQTITVGVSGTVLLPTRIEIAVHPSDLEPFDDALDWLSRDIAEGLRQKAVENGWVVPSGPEVVITADESRPLRAPRAKGRIQALSPDDVSTLKHKGRLVVKPDVAPTAAQPAAAAPRPAPAPAPDRPPLGQSGQGDQADPPRPVSHANPGDRAGEAATRAAGLDEAETRAAGPDDESAGANGQAQAQPAGRPGDPQAPHTPPTGYMAPVTAAAAAASAAAAAHDTEAQKERAAFLQLVATNGGDDLSAVVLASGRPVVLGRSREAHLQVKDRKASGRHCAFTFDAEAGTLHVEDLKSTNGTFVGGRRIEEPSVLRTGDTLGVGTSTWRVDLDELTL